IEDLAGELLDHRLLAAVAGVGDEPPHAESLAAVGTDVDRDLVRRAADAARLDLDLGLHVSERAVPDLDGIVLGPLGDDVERDVDYALGVRLFAAGHHRVDELGDAPPDLDRTVGELGVRKYFALGNFTFAGHGILAVVLLLVLLGTLGPVLGAALAAIGD